MSNSSTIKYLKSKAPEFMWRTHNGNIEALARQPLPDKELWFAMPELPYDKSDVLSEEDKQKLDIVAKTLSKELKRKLDDIQ